MQSCADTEWNMSISEEGLHSLSCSEDEDRGELVCTGLIGSTEVDGHNGEKIRRAKLKHSFQLARVKGRHR